MKKFGIIILLLAAFTLTACSGGYTPKVRIPWGTREETLTYNISVLPDSGGADGNYNYVPSYNDVDYPAKPVAELSEGTYITTIEKTNSSPVEYTIHTEFYFQAVYAEEGFPAGFGIPDPLNDGYIYFDNYIETTAVYYGDNFNSMKSSEKIIDIWEITKVKKNGTPKYNTPQHLEYELHADYSGGNYNYRFLTLGGTEKYYGLRDLYDIAQSGSIKGGDIDNEVLFYYIRAVEMTTDNYSSVSSSMSVADPYLGQVSTLTYGYSSRKSIPKPAGVTEYQFEGDNYDCVQITLSASGDRSGQGIQLFYALNDSLSMSLGNYPSRRQQKLIRMQQSYLQYDLSGRA